MILKHTLSEISSMIKLFLVHTVRICTFFCFGDFLSLHPFIRFFILFANFYRYYLETFARVFWYVAAFYYFCSQYVYRFRYVYYYRTESGSRYNQDRFISL